MYTVLSRLCKYALYAEDISLCLAVSYYSRFFIRLSFSCCGFFPGDFDQGDGTPPAWKIERPKGIVSTWLTESNSIDNWDKGQFLFEDVTQGYSTKFYERTIFFIIEAHYSRVKYIYFLVIKISS